MSSAVYLPETGHSRAQTFAVLAGASVMLTIFDPGRFNAQNDFA